MKGSDTAEIEGSKKALDILGGKIEEIHELTLPFSDIKRNIIIVRKLRQTPTKYPRKAGKPAKEPLI
jgi:16S rRNA (guanine527-N7)-methyltransferase